LLRRPDSHDEFELALGEAIAALQLGNCDLVRLRGTSDGGAAARLCCPALARWRSVHTKRVAPSASTRRARPNLAFECDARSTVKSEQALAAAGRTRKSETQTETEKQKS
jgi:hypothetical protein